MHALHPWSRLVGVVALALSSTAFRVPPPPPRRLVTRARATEGSGGDDGASHGPLDILKQNVRDFTVPWGFAGGVFAGVVLSATVALGPLTDDPLLGGGGGGPDHDPVERQQQEKDARSLRESALLFEEVLERVQVTQGLSI